MTPTGFGLLLDVDGPLASTVTRTLRLPAIADHLAAIANAGCPVVFNTGRSDAFMIEHLVPDLIRAGLAMGTPLWCIGEKGATWFAIEDHEPTAVNVEDAIVVPSSVRAACREVSEAHEEIVFLDESKRTMVSLEQRVTVDNATFLAHRSEINNQLESAIAAKGEAQRIHTMLTSIAIDVEHREAGKALGARRAVELVGQRMDVPQQWYTVGDSSSDHDMADWLHHSGYNVVHLDVDRDPKQSAGAYRVIQEVPSMAHGHAEDDITASYLARWRSQLGVDATKSIG